MAITSLTLYPPACATQTPADTAHLVNGNGKHSAGNSLQARLDAGAVLADIQNVCPEGTKAWMLCLGYLEGDEGYLVRGGNQSLGSTRDAPRPNKRRKLPMYCVLIEHPHEGLILWETGAGVVSSERCAQ